MELPELRTFEAGEGRIAYREWDGDPRATFVLVHGLGASQLSWVQVAEPLSGLGRVLAVDLPGHGASPLAGRGTNLMDHRRAVGATLGKLGSGHVIVAGNSMGGAIALLQAAVEPDSVSGLVLTNSVFPWRAGAFPHPLVVLAFATYATPRLGERLVAWRLRRMKPERLVPLGLRVLAADASTIPDDVVTELVELARARKEDPDVPRSFLGSARSLIRLGRHPSLARRALDHVTCPVLLLHGRRDRFVPAAFAEAELARHPDWRGRFFPDLGHIPQMEAPGRWIAEVADWYSEVFES
jgi:pimeloyl-ACP methyl ester carboxylesterase